MVPPYTPPAPTWLNESELIDGAEDLDAYFLEGDATPIQVIPAIASQADDAEPKPASGRDSMNDLKWRTFIPDALDSEEIVKVGKVSKRKVRAAPSVLARITLGSPSSHSALRASSRAPGSSS
jgi:hypothetical protein